jgi:hypothetical protein
MSRQARSSRDASRAVTPERPKTEGSPAKQDQDMGAEALTTPGSCFVTILAVDPGSGAGMTVYEWVWICESKLA